MKQLVQGHVLGRGQSGHLIWPPLLLDRNDTGGQRLLGLQTPQSLGGNAFLPNHAFQCGHTKIPEQPQVCITRQRGCPGRAGSTVTPKHARRPPGGWTVVPMETEQLCHTLPSLPDRGDKRSRVLIPPSVTPEIRPPGTFLHSHPQRGLSGSRGAAWLNCNCQQAWGMCESTCARVSLWGTVHRKPSKTARWHRSPSYLPASAPL